MGQLSGTVHERSVVLEQLVDVVEHDAVHRREPPRSLDKPDVHHRSLVEHGRGVLLRQRQRTCTHTVTATDVISLHVYAVSVLVLGLPS